MGFFSKFFKKQNVQNRDFTENATTNPDYERFQEHFSLILPAIIGLLKFNIDGGFIVLKAKGGRVDFVASASDYSANMVSLSGGWHKHLLGIKSFIGIQEDADILTLMKIVDISFEEGDAYFRYSFSGNASNNNLYRTWLISHIKENHPELKLKLENSNISIII